MNRTSWFNDLETKADMNSCAIGIIGEIMEIVEENHITATGKLIEIACTLRDLEKAWNAKKPLLQTEAPKEILHPNNTINVAKVESFLEPRYLEQILEERGKL